MTADSYPQLFATGCTVRRLRTNENPSHLVEIKRRGLFGNQQKGVEKKFIKINNLVELIFIVRMKGFHIVALVRVKIRARAGLG
jgi:hypothetical protein